MTGRRSERARQDRAIRQGRGTGQGADYKPWLQLRRNDFASRGRSHFHPSAFMDRFIELLSDLELCVYLHLQTLNLTQLREQFPLQREGVEKEFEPAFPDAQGTVAIARDLEIKHPQFDAMEMKVLSSDALITFQNGRSFAIHVKYERDLRLKRAEELRRIEMEYWNQRGIELLVFTEKNFDSKSLANLQMLSSFTRSNVTTVDKKLLMTIARLAAVKPMNEVTQFISRSSSLTEIQVVDRIKHAFAIGLIRADLSLRRLNWREMWPKIQLRHG
jgi:hypothetical protein